MKACKGKRMGGPQCGFDTKMIFVVKLGFLKSENLYVQGSPNYMLIFCSGL